MKQYRGQGLIEVLITAVVIIGATVALIRFQNGLAYGNSVAQQQSDATILALSELETLRDFQVIATQSPYTAYQNIASGTSTSAGADTTYTLTWTVTSYTNPTYKTLDVTVSWTDRRGVSQSVRLTSQVAGMDPAYSSTVMY